MASSVDGYIGWRKLESDEQRMGVGLTSDVDHDFLKMQMSECDAIIVGASSIRANGNCLTYCGRGGRKPAWLVLARSELPEGLSFWCQDEIPRMIFSPKRLPVFSPHVSNIISEPEQLALKITDYCREHGYDRVLLFGGGLVNRIFYQAGLVDRLKVSIAPLLIGRVGAPRLMAEGLDHPIKMNLQSSHSSENFVFLEYTVEKS